MRHYTREVFGPPSPRTGPGCRQKGVGSEGDILTTLNNYSQVIPSLRYEMASVMGDVLGEENDSPLR
jgi:hypothetical protein